MSRLTGLGALAFAAGAATLAALPGPELGTARLAGWVLALAAAGGLLAAALLRRRPGLADLAVVAVAAALGLRDPHLAGAGAQMALLAGACVVLLGDALLAHGLPGRPVPLRAILAPAALRLAVAGAAAWVAVRVPAWAGRAVSARWADSLDAASVPLLALLGLAALAAVTGASLLGTMERGRRRDQGAAPEEAEAARPPSA